MVTGPLSHNLFSKVGSWPVKDSRIKQLLAAFALLGGLRRHAVGGRGARRPGPWRGPGNRRGPLGAVWHLLHRVPQHRGLGRQHRLRHHVTRPTSPQNIEVFEKVVRKLRSQQMPPGGHEMPDKATRAALHLLDGGPPRRRPAQAHAESRLRRPASPEPQGIRQRGARPARHRDRSVRRSLPRDEPRDGFDNVAAALKVTPSFLDQYISAARTVVVQAMGNKDALPGRHHLSRAEAQHAAVPPGWPAAGHARRHRRGSQLPGRRRVRAQHRQHGAGAVGLQHGVREPAGRHARRQADLRDQHRRRRGHEGHRPEAGSGGRGHQPAPEEHPLQGHGRRRTASW